MPMFQILKRQRNLTGFFSPMRHPGPVGSSVSPALIEMCSNGFLLGKRLWTTPWVMQPTWSGMLRPEHADCVLLEERQCAKVTHCICVGLQPQNFSPSVFGNINT